MAKRIVKWTLDNATLKLHKYLNDTSDVELQASFEIDEIFADFLTLTDVQKYLIVNGIKQRLSDCGAGEIGNVMGKVENAKKVWVELLAGKITGERINATGAGENKRIANVLREASKVVSLEGLIAKKFLNPANFTAEDEAKFQELLSAKAQLEQK